jgi:hypothetical protein
MKKFIYNYFYKWNFYKKFKFKLVKLSNFEMPSPNFAAPSSPIAFPLTNLTIQY